MEPVLQKRLKKIKDKNFVRFHYPGHKGREGGFPPEQVMALDYTETYGTDNLLAAEEIIKESQDRASELFSTKGSYYGVGGSTMAIYAGIFAMAQPGQEILVQRNSHKSVYQGAMLRSLKVHTLDPVYDRDKGLLLGVDPVDLEAHLRARPGIRLLVLTNPSYYGVILRLRELISLAHRYKVGVLVDEAHGGHLIFSHLKKFSALEAGADLVVHSAHKSLAALTQTALIHRKTGWVSRENLEEKIALFTSSSPSYIFLISIEASLARMEKMSQEEKAIFFERVRNFRHRGQEYGYEFYKPGEDKTVSAYDFTKIFFRYPGYSGQDLSEALYKKGVNMELTDGSFVLGLVSQNTQEEDFQRALEAMKSIPKRQGQWESSVYQPLERIKKKEIYESFDGPSRWVDLEEAQGLISANFVHQYPPGVPLILPGEVFTKGHLEVLARGQGIVGLRQGRVRVL